MVYYFLVPSSGTEPVTFCELGRSGGSGSEETSYKKSYTRAKHTLPFTLLTIENWLKSTVQVIKAQTIVSNFWNDDFQTKGFSLKEGSLGMIDIFLILFIHIKYIYKGAEGYRNKLIILEWRKLNGLELILRRINIKQLIN